MAYLVLWFVMTAGPNIPGYIPPFDAIEMHCGIDGAVVGINVDRLVNPTAATWPDPHVVGKHCRQDITGVVAALGPGEYHIATTEMGDGSRVPYIGVDPHVSVTWTRDGAKMNVPTRLNLKGQ